MFQMCDFSVLAAGDIPPFMTPHIQVLLWSIFVFFTLLGLLWKFAWGPIMLALEQREHGIQKKIDDAEKKNAEAIAKVAEYQKLVDASKDEAAAIIAEGKRDVEKLKADILAEANTEAAKSLDRAKHEIVLAKDAAVAEIRDRVVDLAAEMAGRVLAREVKAEDHRRFIHDAIEQIQASKN